MNEPNQLEQNPQQVSRYSFLLRLWRTNRPGNSGWHASLENPVTGERFGFANVEHLFAFLMGVIERDGKRDPGQSRGH